MWVVGSGPMSDKSDRMASEIGCIFLVGGQMHDKNHSNGRAHRLLATSVP